MVEERTIEGTVANWASEIREIKPGQFYSVGVKVGNNWHNITGHRRDALEQLKATYPKGAAIGFVEEKKGQYWNVKGGTITGDVAPTSTVQSTVQAASTTTPSTASVVTASATPRKGDDVYQNRITLGASFRQAFDAQLSAWDKAEGQTNAEEFSRAVAELATELFKAQVTKVKELREEGFEI